MEIDFGTLLFAGVALVGFIVVLVILGVRNRP